MKKKIRFPLSFPAVWLVLLLMGACQQREAGPRVVGVTDGDTIELLENKQTTKVRLHGIDAPERNQDYGTRARQFVSDLCFGKNVTLISHGKDRYGRVVGTIILPDGRSLNQELVRNGLAWHYTDYSKDPELARLEEDARQRQVGIWSIPNPESPWEFRKNRSARAAAKKAAANPPAAAKAPANPRSPVYICESKGATVYHQSQNCSSLKRCKSAVRKLTRQQAETMGRRADQQCLASS